VSDGVLGPSADGVTFQVVGQGQEFPEALGALAKDLDTLLGATTSAEGIMQLGTILRDLRLTPTGPNFSPDERLSAVNQALRLLLQGEGQASRVGPGESAGSDSVLWSLWFRRRDR